MLNRTLFALTAAGFGWCLPIAAHAQVGLSTKPNYDMIEKANQIDESTQRELNTLHNAGVEAIGVGNFATAEATLDQLVRRNPTTTDANFLLALAKIGLGKWDEAKTHLEIAVVKEPKRPEPKTRLGLAYVKLNDLDRAKAQRVALAGLDGDCKKACPDAKWIAEGIASLDVALAPTRPVVAAELVASEAPTGSGQGLASKNFDPTKYSLVTFDDEHDLYDLLIKEGRCEPKKTAEPRQPCALILYRPEEGSEGGLSANFKPVFKVISRDAIWAIHDKKLQKVRIDDLYFDIDDIIGRKRAAYRSVALVGNAENLANCNQGLTCLRDLVVQDMFSMYSNMPDSVVQVIWADGMKDPGTVRVR